MRRKKRDWFVTVGTHKVAVKARSYGNACRLVFRSLIRSGTLKRQPKTVEDGLFEGVSVELRR